MRRVDRVQRFAIRTLAGKRFCSAAMRIAKRLGI
jgi:hypothetical protein